MTQTTYTSNATWVCPAGVTQIQVECWGGGGAGGNHDSGISPNSGGGAGAYSRSILNVTPGNSYAVVVGGGATAGSQGTGGDSSFNTTDVVAKGGSGAVHDSWTPGGQASAGTGDIKFSGGNGSAGLGSNQPGGGGGAAASYAADGPSAVNSQAGAVGLLGTGGRGSDVGTMIAGGGTGVGSGGGGVAEWGYAGTGGAGTNGQVIISYQIVESVAVSSISAEAFPLYLNGIINFSGTVAITERGFVYGTTSVPTNPGNVAPGVSGYSTAITYTGTYTVGAFSEMMFNLLNQHTYYVRAYIQDAKGYVYGDEKTYTTSYKSSFLGSD